MEEKEQEENSETWNKVVESCAQSSCHISLHLMIKL